MRLLHRTFDRIEVPPRSRPVVTADFRAALVTGVLALVCLGVVGSIGNVHAHALHTRLVALGGSVGFLVLAALTVRSAGNEMHRILAPRVGPSHAGVVRLLISVVGFVVTILATLGLLAVPVQHLLLGGALTGVIVGIAAQQALGNVFAGLVLLLARPFNVGDAIRVRSSFLGGELLGRVTGMGLTYVTLETADGLLSVPNSALLAAGIGPQRDPVRRHVPAEPAADHTASAPARRDSLAAGGDESESEVTGGAPPAGPPPAGRPIVPSVTAATE